MQSGVAVVQAFFKVDTLKLYLKHTQGFHCYAWKGSGINVMFEHCPITVAYMDISMDTP